MLRHLRSADRVERTLAWGGVVTLLVHGGFIIYRRVQRPGDFDVAREFGRRFVEHEYLYRNNLHFPYLPAAAMVFAPLSLVPAWVAFALQYSLALVAFWYTLAFLFRMRIIHQPDLLGRGFAVGAATVILAGQYILHDLGNAGPHLLLLFLAVLGTRLVWRGRPTLAAPAYGLLIAIKPPFALLLAFFAWKGRRRLLAASAAALALWLLAPMLHMGWDDWWRHHLAWARGALPFLPFTDHFAAAEPTATGATVAVTAGDIFVWNKNQSLYAALLRNLPFAPRLAAPLLMLALLSLCAWRTRRPYATADDPRWLVESSAALLVCVLCSPITWVQHLVFAVPALFLTVAEQRSQSFVGAARFLLVAVFALLAVVLNPEVLGRETSFRFLGYGPHTVALLLLLGWLLLRRPAPPISTR